MDINDEGAVTVWICEPSEQSVLEQTIRYRFPGSAALRFGMLSYGLRYLDQGVLPRMSTHTELVAVRIVQDLPYLIDGVDGPMQTEQVRITQRSLVA